MDPYGKCPRFTQEEIRALVERNILASQREPILKDLENNTVRVNYIFKHIFQALQENKTSVTGSEFWQKLVSKEIMSTCFDIKVTLDKELTTFSWEKDNPLFKPPFEATIEKDDLLAFLAGNDASEFYDVAFLVEGQTFKGHRLILAQCPKFKAEFLSGLKESRTQEPILFDYPCTAATFSALFDYLYKRTPPTAANCVELYQLADHVLHEPLKKLAKKTLHETISLDNFFDIAFLQIQLNDAALKKLCLWFTHTYREEIGQLDLSAQTALGALKVHLIGRLFNSPYLIEQGKAHFQEKLALDGEFAEICKFVLENQLPRTLVQETMSSKKEAFAPLFTEERKGRYAAEWKAYKALTTHI